MLLAFNRSILLAEKS